ncbi:unnamed protein product [Closterium sp. Yama58-4]|nr:unnamed protein product [Closterium sp. Yama58-4]
MRRSGTHFLILLLCAALFNAASASLVGSSLSRDDGSSAPLASTAQAATPQQLQKKSFAKYVAKLRPTKYDNRLIVGDKGASGIFVAKGIRSSSTIAYAQLRVLFRNLKSKGASPSQSFGDTCNVISLQTDENNYRNLTTAKAGRRGRYTFGYILRVGPASEAQVRAYIADNIVAQGTYVRVGHPENLVALCGKFKKASTW